MHVSVNTHLHHDGRSHHKDIRLYMSDERGKPVVAHFTSAGGLPGPGRIGRWRALDAPHIHDDERRVDRVVKGPRGDEHFTFESHDHGDIHEREGKTGITYLSVGGTRYAISGGTGVHFVKNLDSIEKVAIFEDNSLAQVWLVERARQMGIIPPDNTQQALQGAQPSPVSGVTGMVGTGLKTLGLSFLGGLGAGAGWGLGRRLTDVPNNEKAAAIKTDDPAYSPDAPGESPADFRPEERSILRPSDAAATKTHGVIESRFGLAKGDPL